MTPHSPAPGPASVLVVEDDEFTAKLLVFLLERERYQVHRVADGQAALGFIESQPPTSVALMDVMLPYVDGFGVLRTLRARPAWRHTRVIMLSARNQGRDIAQALDAGADDYLIKPFNPEELLARVRRYRAADPPHG